MAIRWVRIAPTLVLAALVSHAAAAAQFLGPNKCTSCHDHEKQKDWAAKENGAHGHIHALEQLEDKKAAGYARAIGLSDVYSLKGACVRCHATIYNGDANGGVTCESCHGAGSGYLDPHQKKGNYPGAVALGMIDTRGNFPVWARMCVSCHIVTDRRLTSAGHSSGANFELSAWSQRIVHWAPTYPTAQLAAAGKAAIARVGGPAPAVRAEAARPEAPAPRSRGRTEAPAEAERPKAARPENREPAERARPASPPPAAAPAPEAAESAPAAGAVREGAVVTTTVAKTSTTTDTKSGIVIETRTVTTTVAPAPVARRAAPVAEREAERPRPSAPRRRRAPKPPARREPHETPSAPKAAAEKAAPPAVAAPGTSAPAEAQNPAAKKKKKYPRPPKTAPHE
jgi:Cytochrome c554 and c-prime